MTVFERYAPFVQDFIYAHRWEKLRSVQVAAGNAVFNTDKHVLLCASTASGKTEAAFFANPDAPFGRAAGFCRRALYRAAQGADQRSVRAFDGSLRRRRHPRLGMARRRCSIEKA